MNESLRRVGPLVLVGVGGFAGAVLRHLVAVALPGGFPWATLAVNVLGAFLLGVLLSGERLVDALPAGTRPAVATGFLSSFTTYSTFALETAQLPPALAVGNVAANYALGFAAAAAGQAVVRLLR